MSSLYIIDGHAQFFRAYYAIRNPMSSAATGEPTNMVYGFTAMLIKLLREEKPDHLAVVIDKLSEVNLTLNTRQTGNPLRMISAVKLIDALKFLKQWIFQSLVNLSLKQTM